MFDRLVSFAECNVNSINNLFEDLATIFLGIVIPGLCLILAVLLVLGFFLCICICLIEWIQYLIDRIRNLKKDQA